MCQFSLKVIWSPLSKVEVHERWISPKEPHLRHLGRDAGRVLWGSGPEPWGVGLILGTAA